jgi:hypothetical protein
MATYKPGEIAPDSGEFRTVIERGETIPPTSESGNEFRYKRGSKTTH